MSPTLERALKGDLCTGCGLCVGISKGAARMEIDTGGFARPVIDTAMGGEEERLIAASCPAVTLASWAEVGNTHPYWGPYQEVLTGHATDEALRRGASSGAAISGLLIHALESGQVEGVVQTAADPADPRRTITQISRTAAEITACFGSRYGPSSPLADIGRLLAGRGSFAFVGKPCDASALRALGLVDPRVGERFPLILSFFCAGVPSIKGTDQILSDLGIARDDLADFRYRGDGWPGYATATRHDGSIERMSYEESWGNRLSKHVQFRCKICPDAVGGSADVACADAWYGGESGYPQFEEMDGRSLIMVRSEAGAALLASAIKAGDVAAEPLPLGEIDLMQPSQARRKRLIASRLLALAFTFQPMPSFRGVSIRKAARRAGVGETVKSFLGLMRRVVQGRK